MARFPLWLASQGVPHPVKGDHDDDDDDVKLGAILTFSDYVDDQLRPVLLSFDSQLHLERLTAICQHPGMTDDLVAAWHAEPVSSSLKQANISFVLAHSRPHEMMLVDHASHALVSSPPPLVHNANPHTDTC